MGEVFPRETEGFHPPPPANLQWLSPSESLGEAKNNAQMVVVITCVEIIIYQPASIPPSPTLIPLPHSLFLTLSLPSPLKTAAQPEASKAGFTQQSSSRENGCCFQVLFAHLSGGDCSGENGVPGVLVFRHHSFQNLHVGDGWLCSSLRSIIFAFRCLCSESILYIYYSVTDGYFNMASPILDSCSMNYLQWHV